jgi:hypothetical protein
MIEEVDLADKLARLAGLPSARARAPVTETPSRRPDYSP